MRTNQALAYFFLRITMGVNMLIHGFVKLGDAYYPFIEKTQADFAKTVLPQKLVELIAYVIPVAEFVVGVMLLAGLFTRLGIIFSLILMILLMSGQSLLLQWNVVGIQLIYSAIFTWLLYKGKHNELALDRLICKKKE